MVIIWNAILERFNKVSKKLQSVQIDLGVVEDLYNSLSAFLQEVRSNFEHYEEEAKILVDTEDYSADLRRQRTRKRHHDEIDAVDDTRFNGRSKMVSEVNIILDRLMSELNRRKQAYSALNSTFGLLLKLPELDAASISFRAQQVVQRYPGDVDQYFSNECLHFRNFVPEEIVEGGIKRKPTAHDLLQIIRTKKL